jgi:hypothetical protein
VSDCCLTPIQQFFSYIMARISLFSMRWWWGPLCSRPTRWVGFLVPAYWNNSPWVDMSLHSDTLFWFRSLILSPYCCVLSREATNANSNSLVWPDRGLNPRSTALEASTLNITPPMRLYNISMISYIRFFI